MMMHSGSDTHEVRSAPIEHLYRLLLSLFGSGERFRRWIALAARSDAIVAELPENAESTAATLFGAIDVLNRRGWINGEFFVRLEREFPLRRADIARVAAAWGATVTTTMLPEPEWTASCHILSRGPVGAVVLCSIGLGIVASSAPWSQAPESVGAVVVEPPRAPVVEPCAPEGPQPAEALQRPTAPAPARVRKSNTREPAVTVPAEGCTISPALAKEMSALASEQLTSPALTERFTLTLHSDTGVTKVSPRPASWQAARSRLYQRLLALGPADLPGCADMPIDVTFSIPHTKMDPRAR